MAGATDAPAMPCRRSASATKPAAFISSTKARSAAAASSPRLFGRPPASLGGATFTAENVEVSGDLRRIDLTDARLYAGASEVHVRVLRIRGLLPFARASALPPWLRAAALGVSAMLSSALSSIWILRAGARGGLGRLYAGALGVSGPLAALAAMRFMELRLSDAPSPLELCQFAGVPVFAVLAVTVVARARKLAPRARRW